MLRMGNLTPEKFSERVGTEFTAEEIQALQVMRSGNAILTGPDDFHIFSDPGLSITVGSRDAKCIPIFVASNARKTWNRSVDIDLDEAWKAAEL